MPLSPAEARTLLDAARGDRLEALYVLAVTTGMRQGEIPGLGRGDVELEAGTVKVRRTLTLARAHARRGEGDPARAGARTRRTLPCHVH